VEGLHLRRDFVLRRVAAAGVADGREADRSWFSGKREDVGGGRAGVDGAAAIDGGGCSAGGASRRHAVAVTATAAATARRAARE
jgi:hypothetical protein